MTCTQPIGPRRRSRHSRSNRCHPTGLPPALIGIGVHQHPGRHDLIIDAANLNVALRRIIDELGITCIAAQRVHEIRPLDAGRFVGGTERLPHPLPPELAGQAARVGNQVLEGPTIVGSAR